MSNPKFPDPLGVREIVQPGATSHKAGMDMPRRMDALERGAATRTAIGPSAGMYAAGSQTITENTVTQITGFTKTFQTDSGMADTANHRIVIPKAGLYRASGQVGYVPAGVNIQEMVAYLLLNGSQIAANGRPALAGPVTHLGPQVSRLYPMSAGDVVTLSTYWYAAVGGTYATSGGSTVFLDVEWVGATPTA